MGKRRVVWFRKGLRIHDNPSLFTASSHGDGHLFPIFILDPRFIDVEKNGMKR